MREIFKYCIKYKFLFLGRLFFTILKSVISIAFAVVLGNIIDIFIQGKIELFLNTILFCIAFILIEIVIFTMDGIISAQYSKKTINNMRIDLFNKIMSKDINNFTANNTGAYISILNNDISIIKTDCIDNIFDLFFQILSFLATLILMLSISSTITVTIFIMAILSLLFTSVLSGKVTQKRVNIQIVLKI